MAARTRTRTRDSAIEAGRASAAAAEVEASLAVPLDPKVAGFFDVDNTMMQGASIYHFARGLAARDFFTKASQLAIVSQWRDNRHVSEGRRFVRLRSRNQREHP